MHPATPCNNFILLPAYPPQSTVKNHVRPFIFQEEETETQGQAGPRSGTPGKLTAQAGLRPRAWDPAHVTVWLEQPPYCTSVCHRRRQRGMLQGRDLPASPGASL